MEIKITKKIILRILALLLCFYLAIIPFFQPKKVKANPLAGIAIVGVGVMVGMIGTRFVNQAFVPADKVNEINEKTTTYLQEAFPDPVEYNKQLGIIENLGNDLLAGKDIDWSKYSGKALYAVLKGVVDVVWPTTMTEDQLAALPNYYIFMGYTGNVAVFISYEASQFNGFPVFTLIDTTADRHYYNMSNLTPKSTSINVYAYNISSNRWYNPYGGTNSSPSIYSTPSAGYTAPYGNRTLFLNKDNYLDMVLSGQNTQKVPNISAKTANKLKLPTRLPQTVINNINNFIDGSTENLIVNPTPEELPTLPEGYNPNTDDLINLPGYEDVTPDQPGSEAPEPTPTPEPTPEYNGDKWVNPIGDFMDGLLKFMKAAFVPTLSLNLDALNSMPDNLSEKFPFSLPGDLVRLFSVFQAEPVPLAFDWEVDFTSVGAGKIPIKGDLSMFDEYAPLFRNLAFIAFIIGLAWKTFGMFFGGGDE